MRVNGLTSVLIARDGVIIVLVTVETSPQGIGQIMWVMNPAKLTAISKSLQAAGQPQARQLHPAK